MDLASKFHEKNPWPARDGEKVLFILDARNSFEQDLLQRWIHHHTRSGSDEFHAPQVSMDLGDDRGGIDSAQLVMALALPGDTLVTPLRVAWQPSREEIDSGPRNPHGISRFAHSVLGVDFDDRPGHPTVEAERATIAFFVERLQV